MDVTVINMTGDADRTRCLVGEFEALLRVDVQHIEFDVLELTMQMFGVDKLQRAVPDISVVVITESMYDIVDAVCDNDSMILGLTSIESSDRSASPYSPTSVVLLAAGCRTRAGPGRLFQGGSR